MSHLVSFLPSLLPKDTCLEDFARSSHQPRSYPGGYVRKDPSKVRILHEAGNPPSPEAWGPSARDHDYMTLKKAGEWEAYLARKSSAHHGIFPATEPTPPAEDLGFLVLDSTPPSGKCTVPAGAYSPPRPVFFS